MKPAGAVILPAPVARAIRSHARQAMPRECCGFLVGRGRTVEYAVAMPNRAPGTRHYLVDPRAHIDLLRVLRRMRPPLGIIGVYHSHPDGPPHPSETDLARSPDSRWIQVIAGPVGTRIPLHTYCFEAGLARRLTVRSTPDSRS